MNQDTPADYDVAIVGSGVSGALIANELAKAGIRVVIVEAGPRTDREESLRRFRSGNHPFANNEWAPQTAGSDMSYFIQTGPVPFAGLYERRVGGSTWHWAGACPRLLPNDFAIRTNYGVGVDWPLTYDDLEPWYLKAEYELGVAGDSTTDYGSPRSGDFPMPPIPFASGDALFVKAGEKLGLPVVMTPQAKNSIESYMGRPQCCGSGTCSPICPIQARYDATTHLDMAEANGVTLLENSVVFRIDLDDSGNATGVTFRRPDKTEGAVTCRLLVVAANAIETPKLLLMSASDRAPNGVANRSDQVGRNLADHIAVSSCAVVDGVYAGSRGPLEIAGIDAVRDGHFRSQHAAFRIQVLNTAGSPRDYAKAYIDAGYSGAEVSSLVRYSAPRSICLSAIIEQLPDPENRVTVHPSEVDAIGIPRPQIHYSIDDYTRRGIDVAQEVNRQVLEAAGGKNPTAYSTPASACHIMGTTRMGADPATSVTDQFGRSHDHPNLFIAGSSLFPAGGAANPTLTISAVALRTANHIREEFGVVPVSTPVT
jgi:choline dehydrogenase-like flavoprotein